MNILRGLLGLAVFLGICWLFSNNRRKIKWRIVGWGIGLQIVFALLVLNPYSYPVFRWVSDAFARLIAFTDDGARFVWGWLYKHEFGNSAAGPVFIVDILMTIVFFAALMSLLYHLGVMQWLVAGIAKVMRKTMGTSGSETLSASANIFVGQTEAPLVVKPFIDSMTKSEITAVMTGGFATVAGGVLAAYVMFGIDAGHLVAASFMSAPAALVCAKMFHPETEESKTAGEVKIQLEKTSANVFDAICVGAGEGMKLVLNVAAMLLAFLAIIAMINWGFEQVLGISFTKIVGWLFAPIAWVLGVPVKDCADIGQLLGVKMIANEFLAYLQLKDLAEISPRSYVIATYAFCGFANFGSIAIQIGGISTIAPGRRKDLAVLGFRAMLAGTIAAFLTANIASALLTDEQVDRDFRKNKARTAATYEKTLEHLDAFMADYPESSYGEEFRELRVDYLEPHLKKIGPLELKLAACDLYLSKYPDSPHVQKVVELRAEAEAKQLEDEGRIDEAIRVWEKVRSIRAEEEIKRLKEKKDKQ